MSVSLVCLKFDGTYLSHCFFRYHFASSKALFLPQICCCPSPCSLTSKLGLVAYDGLSLIPPRVSKGNLSVIRPKCGSGSFQVFLEGSSGSYLIDVVLFAKRLQAHLYFASSRFLERLNATESDLTVNKWIFANGTSIRKASELSRVLSGELTEETLLKVEIRFL